LVEVKAVMVAWLVNLAVLAVVAIVQEQLKQEALVLQVRVMQVAMETQPLAEAEAALA
jgi:hypothetical protein